MNRFPDQPLVRDPARWARRGAAAAILILTGMAEAWAHPGHAPFDHGVVHGLQSPDHLLPLMLAGAALCALGRRIPRPWPRRLLQSAGAIVLVLGVIHWGIST